MLNDFIKNALKTKLKCTKNWKIIIFLYYNFDGVNITLNKIVGHDIS